MIQKKFKQSIEFNSEVEQAYYDQARVMMKENGIASMNMFLKNEVPNIPQSSLKINKNRFIEIMEVAREDYGYILFSGGH